MSSEARIICPTCDGDPGFDPLLVEATRSCVETSMLIRRAARCRTPKLTAELVAKLAAVYSADERAVLMDALKTL